MPDLRFPNGKVVMLPRKTITEGHTGEAWCHRSVLAHFLQQGQIKDSAGGTGALISELGNPASFIQSCVRGQCSEETSGWLLAVWGDRAATGARHTTRCAGASTPLMWVVQPSGSELGVPIKLGAC